MHKKVHAWGRVRLLDQQLLGRLMKDAVEREYAGNLSAAVRETNRKAGSSINQSTAWRLVAGKTTSISAVTLKWMRALLPIAERRRLHRVLLTGEPKNALSAYVAWLTKELRASRPRADGDWSMARRFSSILGSMRKIAPADFNGFEGRVSKARRHTPDRIRLAYWRIVLPFLEADETCGVERSWEELGEREAVHYVRAALKCEEILLRRLPALQRAQGVLSEERLTADLERWVAEDSWGSRV